MNTLNSADLNSWFARADLAQRSLDHFFGAAEPQLLANAYPAGDWWLARATGRQEPLDDARAIWAHVVEHGWSETRGASVAWREQQPYYKNTPANGPFAILSARLIGTQPATRSSSQYGTAAFDWITATLGGARRFVEDGINREGDGRVDTQWRFTYNQGLYVGAAVALDEVLHRAGPPIWPGARTATTALVELAPDGVVVQRGWRGRRGPVQGRASTGTWVAAPGSGSAPHAPPPSCPCSTRNQLSDHHGAGTLAPRSSAVAYPRVPVGPCSRSAAVDSWVTTNR